MSVGLERFHCTSNHGYTWVIKIQYYFLCLYSSFSRLAFDLACCWKALTVEFSEPQDSPNWINWDVHPSIVVIPANSLKKSKLEVIKLDIASLQSLPLYKSLSTLSQTVCSGSGRFYKDDRYAVACKLNSLYHKWHLCSYHCHIKYTIIFSCR